MFQTTLVTTVLLVIGCAAWIRRHSWRLRWDGVLTLGIIFQGAGFLLCVPTQSPTVGRLLFYIGTAHVRDYLGHLCFMSSALCIVYAAGCRLLSDDMLARLMRRIEYPSAAAAVTMGLCLFNSKALKTPATGDFFAMPCDSWLTAYWLSYASICLYILGYLVRLLLVLRRDPRNRTSSDIFIIAVGIGCITIVAVILRAITAARFSVAWMWLPLGTASILAAFASAWSWRGRTRTPTQ